MGVTLFAVEPTTRVLVPGREPSGFAEFWRAYPRKVGKGAARTAFVKALRKASAETVMAGLGRAKWPADPQFIPHPSTWLNSERWDDESPDPMDPVLRAAGL